MLGELVEAQAPVAGVEEEEIMSLDEALAVLHTWQSVNFPEPPIQKVLDRARAIVREAADEVIAREVPPTATIPVFRQTDD
jgi:hypothetical protein